MAGHSHWAGIKHKKGKADKQRSKIFSKLSKEITVAAKLGDKDTAMNQRLRSAIQAARYANMHKDNIERAIDKSSAAKGVNFENSHLKDLFVKDSRNDNDLEYTLLLIKKYNIIKACYQKAQHYINLASNSLSVFSDCEEKTILENLTSFRLSRNF